jgi:hypothetical protein
MDAAIHPSLMSTNRGTRGTVRARQADRGTSMDDGASRFVTAVMDTKPRRSSVVVEEHQEAGSFIIIIIIITLWFGQCQ